MRIGGVFYFMPRPRPGETEDEYIPRCISYVMSNEGIKDSSHAAAKCHGLWKQYKEGKMGAEEFDGWVTVEEMKEFCPDCAEQMEAHGFSKINIYAIERIPEPMLRGLCAKFGPSPGFFTRCSQSSFGGFPVSDKARFCGALKKACVARGMASYGESMYLIDEIDNYVTVKPGEPLRLFKFGRIIKKGVERIITPELAAKFKIPHFKPPIKLGGHEDALPAGGHLVGLEVREDGLYGKPEYNEKGSQALAEGAWRYTSPEVIWDEDGGFENPETGEMINGPLIVGLALLHRPHLGENAALYHVEPIGKEKVIMTDENVMVSKNFFESLLSRILPEKPEIPEEYKAAVKERDDLKKDKVKEEFGAAFVKLGEEKETLEMLAGMSKEQAEWVIRNFKALSKQIDESKLTGEEGDTDKGIETPGGQFHAAILEAQKEHKVDYLTAMGIVRELKPELAKAYTDTL